MTVATGLVRPNYPTLAPLEKRPGGILDVASLFDNPAWFMGDPTGLLQSYSCITTDSKALFPCPATDIAAPVQSASTTATTGGTLAAGTYKAIITALNARGETIGSNEQSQTTTGAASTITWNWAAVTGATGYRVYVTALNGATNSETFLITLGNVLTYVWTGTPARAATGSPPTTNTAVVSVSKTFNGPSWMDGFKFAVYAGAVCKPVGLQPDQELEDLKQVFLLNESKGVERAIMQQRFIAGTWAAPTDLTPAGGAVTPLDGLALLESHAAANYAGLPTIHADRGIAGLLASQNAVVFDNGIYRSRMFSKVVAGAGYGWPNNSPTNTAPAAGEMWLYASGEVLLAPGDLVAQDSFNRDTNEQFALVERPYVASVDCYAAGVRIKTTPGTP